LQFLLHLIGDVHQPLHASDEHDQGGNQEQVQAEGQSPGNLHRYWDVEFVRAQGSDPRALAARLIAQITPQEIRAWQTAGAADWARESYAVGASIGFGQLPSPMAAHRYRLSREYVQSALDTVQLQLKRAGVRLACVLNRDLR
jgi:S1/P1 Nuclease